MIRLLLFLVLIGGLIYLFRLMHPLLQNMFFKKCDYCDGKGFWRGTRGEKNHCKQCMGTGKPQ